MPVNKYEAFLKAAELGSLTRAAVELGVTQSAVSHMIGALEEELGFSLLKRGRSGARATAEGERVLPAIRGMLNSREQLEQTAAAIRGLDCGTVRIGTFTSVAVHWLPGMIKRFQADYPNVELKLMNGDYHDVEQWLADGSCDLGFIALPTKQRGKVTALLEDRLLAVVPKDHRLASLPRFPIKEVEHEPFISLLETSDHDARRALDAAGVTPNIRYTTKDDYAIIAMVEQGLGVSIMPELLLSGRNDNVRIMELTPPASRVIGLCLPDADRAGPATTRFAQCVSDWVREHYARI
ncbi:MAG TPA: LysR family transcriptional regulator [Candidatus Scatomorpha stercoravium]|nr:LysR family transcriptional regulator [Candidatus Scatomorpha stercoravium]